MEKDYSLLRPFDLEAVKHGEKICNSEGDELWDYVAGPDAHGILCVEVKSAKSLLCNSGTSSRYFRIAPLAWVEGKPVYRGDTVYTKEGRAVVVKEMYHDHALTDGEWVVSCEYATWQKPKTKREGWMNLYESGENYVYPTKLRADSQATFARIGCIRIEWEE